MSAFVVSPENGESELLGKLVSDLQSDIAINDNAVTGTLKYVTDYTGFSGDPELQEGNFIALKVSNVPTGAEVDVEVVGGYSGPVTLDSDMNCVLRIEDKDAQTIKFTCSKGTEAKSRTFTLTGLTCEDEE